MAGDVDMQRLVVSLEAQVNKFQKALDSASGVADRKANQIERRFQKANSGVSASFDKMGRSSAVALKATTANMQALSQSGRGLSAVFGGIGSALATSSLIEYANTWTRVTRAIDASGTVFGIALKPATELNKLANESRVDLDAYAKLYIRTSAAIRDYGFEAGTAETVTSTLAKALKLGGAAAGEQASVLLQFSQALQKGKLDGDEFRSVMENAGVVQELLASRLGVTKGEIIKLAGAGKLQIKDLIGAMVDGSAKVDRIFKQMPQTVDEAFAVMRNNFVEFIGNADKATGATEALAGGIVTASQNLDKIAIVAGAILGSATLRMVAFAAAATSAANPVTLLAGAVAGLATGYAVMGDKIPISKDGLVSLRGAVSGFIDVVAGNDEVEKFNASLDRMTEAQRNAAISAKELEESQKGTTDYFQTLYDGAQMGITALHGLLTSGDGKEGGPLSDWIAGTKQLASWIGELTGLSAAATAGLDLMDKAAERARAVELQKGVEKANLGQGLADHLAGKTSNRRAAPSSSGEDDGKRSAYEREIEQIRKRTAALQAEIKTIDASVFAQERAKAAAELRAALDDTVRKRGTAATKAEIAAIDEVAASYADANAKAAMLQAVKSQTDGIDAIHDEIELLGLYGKELTAARIEQELLNEAKRLGVEVMPWQREEYRQIAVNRAALENYRDTIKEVQETSKEMLTSFISDMRQGVSATEALGNAMNKLADKLLETGLDSLLTSIVGGAGASLLGGGATTAGWGATVTPFADGGIARNGKAVSLPRFAGGGVSNRAAIFGEAGPEAAIPLPDGRTVPVTLSMPNIPKASAATSQSVSIVVSPVFQVQNGTPEGVDKMKSDIVPTIKKLVKQEIVEAFNRDARFAKSGI